MDLRKINLNYYAFGYLGGFVDKTIKKMSLNELIRLTNKYKLGGIEFPVDYLFSNNYDGLSNYIKNNKNLNIFLSFETFSLDRLKAVIPILKDNQINRARIKMSNYFGGNRFMVNNFSDEYEFFLKNLLSIKDYLIDHNFQLLIENHQDLNSFDILNIINGVSEKCIGVNWDIGNSLPTGETPFQFYHNLKDFIYNIHLKDYNIIKNGDSIEYYRCVIGEGNIGINDVLRLLQKNIYSHTMSIELGAYSKRISYIFKEDYWSSYLNYSDNHKSIYFDYINSCLNKTVIIDNNEKPSKNLELLQIDKSISNLKTLT